MTDPYWTVSTSYDATLIVSHGLSQHNPHSDGAEVVVVGRLTLALEVGGLEPWHQALH